MTGLFLPRVTDAAGGAAFTPTTGGGVPGKRDRGKRDGVC